MSQERRRRQQERAEEDQPSVWMKRVAIAVLILVAAAGMFFFVHRKQTRRLDAFAQCLSAKGAKMYGAFWCPHCADQKEMFGSSFAYAPYIECGVKGSHLPAQVCTAANVQHYPTWVFADGSRVEGAHSLEFLSQQTGCALP
jgi:hypothetical protein